MFALKKFRNYIWCQKFDLSTDQEALKYVINNRDQQRRIASEYDFEVVYRLIHETRMAIMPLERLEGII